jgi:hypothetical protein
VKNPKTVRVKMIKLPDGRIFPVYKGEILPRVPGSVYTWKDINEGSPRTRLILSTMTNAELRKEYNESLKASFNRMWPAAKSYFKLVKEEVERRQHKKNPQPKRLVRIYGRVLRIEAQKVGPHKNCDAECKRCNHKYVHDFRKGAVMYGQPDGSILIKKG